MEITQLDQKVLDQLGLSNIPDEDKQAVLAMLDQRLEKRFLANLLISLPEDKRQELDQKVEAMGEKPEPGKVIELVLNLHPDAKIILEKSAQEIVEELKQEQVGKTQPPTPPQQTPPSTSLGTGPSTPSEPNPSANSDNYYQ